MCFFTFTDCQSLQKPGMSRKSGVYSFLVGEKNVKLFCEMRSANGGWTVSIYNVIKVFKQLKNENLYKLYSSFLAKKFAF